MENYNLYRDIQARTGGEIYLGVVGPVRTGKSTFIKRFLELMVIPQMSNQHEKERTLDELPQSAQGRTIMTTEPKFIPKDAAMITVGDVELKVRLVDCVGFLVEGATGHMEESGERMVKTPWEAKEIPFEKAAEIGTSKVIKDHATIGIVITTDGSFGEIPKENYRRALEKTIAELKEIGKPFVLICNSQKPFSEECVEYVKELEEAYQVTVLAMNCKQLRKEDIDHILETVLLEFPIKSIHFELPKWAQSLSLNHEIIQNLMECIREVTKDMVKIGNASKEKLLFESPYVSKVKVDKLDLSTGEIQVEVRLKEEFYYEMLSQMCGEEISNEYELLELIQKLSKKKGIYKYTEKALENVKGTGYGVILPQREEIVLDEPEIVRHGSKFGIKIRSVAPSIHLIRAGIETEIAPIVGSEQQAKDLIDYIKNNTSDENGIWNVNIFGKSVEDLVLDGMNAKLSKIGEESQSKLQDSMQKIVNDSNGGMVCIII